MLVPRPLLRAAISLLLAVGASVAGGGCQPAHESADGSGSARDGMTADQISDAAAAEATVIPPGLVAAYDFDQGKGTVALDSSGNFNNAGLIGSVVWGTAGHSTGDVAIMGGGYVLLPPGTLDQARAFTFAAWVKLGSDRIWQRIMDFGSGFTSYMFLTPHSDPVGTIRFAISRGGSFNEQRLDGPSALPVGVWKHVAVVLNGTSGTIYVDGQLAVTSTDITYRPIDIAPLPNQWLGRSEFTADPSFDGEIDQVRVYDRALSAAEVLALYEQP